jgi:hypothetical protein
LFFAGYALSSDGLNELKPINLVTLFIDFTALNPVRR